MKVLRIKELRQILWKVLLSSILRRVFIIGGLSFGLFILIFYLMWLKQTLPEWKIYLQKADRLFEEGELEKAKKFYLKIRDNFPSCPEIDRVNFQLARVFRNAGLFHRAIFFYQEVADKKDSPFFYPALFEITECLFRVEDYTRVIKYAQFIVNSLSEKNPYLPKIHLLLADSLGKILKEKEALMVYRKIIKEYPEKIEAGQAYLRLGDFYFSKKRYSEAILSYSSFLKNFSGGKGEEKALYMLVRCYLEEKETEKAFSILSLLKEKYPESSFLPEGLFYAGIRLFEEKNFSQAKILLQEADRMVAGKCSLKLNIKRYLGRIYAVEKNLSEAIRIYQSIIQEYLFLENLEDVYLELGKLYFKKGEYEKAAEVFRSFIFYFPLSSYLQQAYLMLGRIFLTRGFYFDCIKLLSQALEFSSSRENSIKAYRLLFEAYKKTGLWKEATDCLRKVVLLSSGEEKIEAQLKLVKFYLERKDIFSAKKVIFSIFEKIPPEKVPDILSVVRRLALEGEEKLAFEICDELLKIAGSNKEVLPFLLFEMGKLQKNKDVSAAITHYEKVRKLTAGDISRFSTIRKEALLDLSYLYYISREYEKAKKIYLEALKELSPDGEDYVWCLFQLGNCFRKLKDKEEAKKFYQEVQESYPHTLFAITSKAML